MFFCYINTMRAKTISAFAAILAAICLPQAAVAHLTVTKTTLNYQQGMAIIPGGNAIAGWQMASDTNGDSQTAFNIRVTENVTGDVIYDSGKTQSAESQMIALPQLPYNSHGYAWQVRVWDNADEPSEWSEPQFVRVAPSELGAQWIGAITREFAGIPDGRWSNAEFKKDDFKAKWADVDTLSARSIMLRREFTTDGQPENESRKGKKRQTEKTITDAVVYVSGLGHYEMRINGVKVGDSEFAPLWSEYDKTVYYNVYDVTPLLAIGDNAITVLLGNGFFNVQGGKRYSKLQTSFGAPQLLMRLDINYSDGTSQSIVSDTQWKYSPSPITFNSIYGGESYDARLEQRGCHNTGFDDTSWLNAVAVEGPKGGLCPQTTPPVKIMERYGIKTWSKIPADSLDAASKRTKRTIHPSAFVADMGQNLAGFPEITVKGERGQKITMIVSENLTRQGACDQRQTGRQHYYEYTIADTCTATWHPRFSYYGFRYIQVEGAVIEGQPNPYGLPVISSLQSCFVHNSAEEVSSFECSNKLFTDTHRLIERAERSNMQSVLTDCPHREKLGWLEQDHLCGPSLFFNYDMTCYTRKVIRDITDTQKPDGMVPTTAPQYVSFGNLFDDSPEWGSTLVIMPFMYYAHYGDSSLIADNYDAMRKYVDYLTSRADSGIVSHGLGDWYDYGPWVAGFSRNTPVPLVATAHYIYDIRLLCRAARMTGNDTDAAKYSSLADEVTAAFNRKFYNPDSCYYGSGSQASNAIPLYMGIVEEKDREAVMNSLISDIAAHGDRLTTGDVGNRYLFRTLSDSGHDDILYNMLNHYETPGYGYQLTCGATTLTEQWNPRKGSSWNHFMMGQIDEWLFRSLAGIRQQEGTCGMRHLLISPRLVGDMEYVKASTASLYGVISVDCTRHRLTVSVPVGSDALVVTPAGGSFSVGSGRHTFEY